MLLGAVVLAGILVNLFLALVARLLPGTAAYGRFGAFMSIALIIAFGAFLPLEQEMARVMQTSVRPVSALRAAAVTAAVLAVLAAAVCTALLPVLRSAFGGSSGLFLATLAVCVISGVQFLARGMFIGLNRLDVHAGVLVLDAGLRVVLVLALLLAGAGKAPALYAWTLVVAILLAHGSAYPWLLRQVRRAPVPSAPAPFPVRAFGAAVGSLLIASLCAQLLQNGPPLFVAAVAGPDRAGAAGRFLAAFTLARVPLFVAVPIQSAVVPTLVRLLAAGRRAALFRLVGGISAALAALAAAGGALAAWVGPSLVGLVFGNRYVVSGGDLAAMIVGVLAHLGLLLSAQALIAAGRHARVALTWGAAVVAAAVPAAVITGLLARGELAFLTGSVVGWIVGTALLAEATRNSAHHGSEADSVRPAPVVADELAADRSD